MKPSNILERAKQGDPKVIAALMHRSLQPKGISVQVARKDQNLHILLESPQIPDQKSLVAFIRQGLEKFGIQSIKTVKIYGRRIGQAPPVWTQTIELGKTDSWLSPEQETSAAPNWPVIATEISENLTDGIPASDRNFPDPSLPFHENHRDTTLESASESATLLADNEIPISGTISATAEPSSIKWPSEVIVKETVMENHSATNPRSHEEELLTAENHDSSLAQKIVPPGVTSDEVTDRPKNTQEQFLASLDKPRSKILILLLIYLGAFAIAFPQLRNSAPPAPPAPSPQAQPTATATPVATSPPSSLLQTTAWQQGINTAIRAATLNQSAQTQSEWNTVANTWREAIALMKTVPADSPNYQNAQQKILEYQKYLDYAQERANEF